MYLGYLQHLKDSVREKQRLYNWGKKSSKSEHKTAYSRAQKSVQPSLKQAKWEYINGILQAGENVAQLSK